MSIVFNRIWERLEQLQHSADDWTKHERAYKEALLAMSLQQKYLLDENTKQCKKIDYLTSLISKKVLPQQASLSKLAIKQMEQLQASARGCCKKSRIKVIIPRIARIRQEINLPKSSCNKCNTARRCVKARSQLMLKEVQRGKNLQMNATGAKLVQALGACCTMGHPIPKQVKAIANMQFTGHHIVKRCHHTDLNNRRRKVIRHVLKRRTRRVVHVKTLTHSAVRGTPQPVL